MGAFDGLRLYQTVWREPAQEEPPVKSKPTSYYVSWDGCNGGATGKHYRTKRKAVAVYRRKLHKGLHPACWFNIED